MERNSKMAEGGNLVKSSSNESIERKLKERSRLPLKDMNGNTPLHLAAKNGHFEAIKVLLNLGTPLEERNMKGETPLMLAVSSGSEEGVRCLLEAGADCTTVTDYGNSVWHAAASVGHVGILNLLMDALHKKTIKEPTTGVPQSSTQNSSDVEDASTIGKKIKPKKKDSCKERNPIDLLGDYSDTDVDARKENSWEKIYKEADEINSDSDEDLFAVKLPYLVSTSSRREVKLEEERIELQKFLDSKAILGFHDIHKRDENGFTGLHHAAACGAEKAALRLISRNADVNAEGVDGITPILMAAAGGSLKIFNKLIEAGANYLKTDDKGRTALHIAANRKHIPIVKRLLSLGMDPNEKCREGYTPLHFAAMRLNNVKMCKFLIKSGSKVTELNKYGQLPISITRDEELFQLLMLPK